MKIEKQLEIEPAIIAILDARQRDYLTVTQLLAALPAKQRKTLGVTRGAKAAAALKIIRPLIGARLREMKKGQSSYIVRAMSDADLVFNYIAARPGLSPGMLGKGLPLKRTPFVAALNTLVRDARIDCRFKDTQNYTLAITPIAGSITQERLTADDHSVLRAAYASVGGGRGFVRIHRLREQLGWSRARFDAVLMQLMADYSIQLHGGDPSSMTEMEIKNSYMDENNILYTAVSWRET